MKTIDYETMRPGVAEAIDAEFDALDIADAIRELMDLADFIEETAEEGHLGPTAARRAGRAIRGYARMLPKLHPPAAPVAA